MAMLDIKNILTYILQRLANTGNRKFSGPDATTTATGKFYKVASVDLEPGTWILMGHVWFAYQNTTGFRRGFFTADNVTNGTTTAPSNYAMAGYQEFAATAFGSGRADVKAGPIVVTASQTPYATINLVAYQNSGVNVSANGRIYAVKVYGTTVDAGGGIILF